MTLDLIFLQLCQHGGHLSGKPVNVRKFGSCQEIDHKSWKCHDKLYVTYLKFGTVLVFSVFCLLKGFFCLFCHFDHFALTNFSVLAAQSKIMLEMGNTTCRIATKSPGGIVREFHWSL